MWKVPSLVRSHYRGSKQKKKEEKVQKSKFPGWDYAKIGSRKFGWLPRSLILKYHCSWSTIHQHVRLSLVLLSGLCYYIAVGSQTLLNYGIFKRWKQTLSHVDNCADRYSFLAGFMHRGLLSPALHGGIASVRMPCRMQFWNARCSSLNSYTF